MRGGNGRPLVLFVFYTERGVGLGKCCDREGCESFYAIRTSFCFYLSCAGSVSDTCHF